MRQKHIEQSIHKGLALTLAMNILVTSEARHDAFIVKPSVPELLYSWNFCIRNIADLQARDALSL